MLIRKVTLQVCARGCRYTARSTRRGEKRSAPNKSAFSCREILRASCGTLYSHTSIRTCLSHSGGKGSFLMLSKEGSTHESTDCFSTANHGSPREISFCVC